MAATTGAAGSTGLADCSVLGSAPSEAGFSRGATGTGSSILGGYSSTLAGVATSALGLDLKKSPTRAERRRVTFKDLNALTSPVEALTSSVAALTSSVAALTSSVTASTTGVTSLF